MRGLFITFEGGEGSGKTTQLRLLARRLRAFPEEVIETRDPGGTTIGKEIRSLLLSLESAPMSEAAELLLYEASRAQLVQEVIGPAMARGAVVLSDRFTDSTLAYQGYGRGLDLDLILRLNQLATAGLRPDLTVLLDVDPSVGLDRCAGTASTHAIARDRIEQEPLAFHQRARQGYLALARQEPGRIRVLDATMGMTEIETAVWHEFVRLRQSRFTDQLSAHG